MADPNQSADDPTQELISVEAITTAELDQLTESATERAREIEAKLEHERRHGTLPDSWAPWSEVFGWAKIAAVAGAILILGTLIVSSFLPGSSIDGGRTILLGDAGAIGAAPVSLAIAYYFFRNILVLGLHYFCCQLGAIVSRPHKPLRGKAARFSALHRPLPSWMENAALGYALAATALSILLQMTALGFILADISAYTGLAHYQIILLVLPHAIPELIGVFLPMGLFITQSYRRQLRPLARYANQALVLAIPLIVIAAIIESTISPFLFELVLL